ncbi:hypothetical protein V8E55_012067 [Tylopilus felleus]
MSKRPQAPSQPQGPQPKHIHMEGKFEQANTRIHGLVQQLSQVQSGLPLLVSSLLIVFMGAPPEACMRATPSGYEIEELLKDNPDLQKALQDAIDQGRYEDVMSLSILQKNIQQNITNPPESEGVDHSSDQSEYLIIFYVSERSPYVAGLLHALLKTVDEYVGNQHYNHSISIVQSSGTGKSRGVAEAAKIRFTFLFNLRPDVQYYTYPPPDVGVRDYLVKPDSHKARARYAAFLCSLFTCAEKCISGVDRQGTPLAKWWYEYLNAEETKNSLGSERMKFYVNVVKESEKIEREHDGRGEQESLDLLRTSCKNFVAFLQNQYNLDNPTACPCVLCILVFDEAQELTIASNYEDRCRTCRNRSIDARVIYYTYLSGSNLIIS